MSQELVAVLTQLERERGVSKEILQDTLKSAIASAARKQYSLGENVEVNFEPESGEISVGVVKEVVRVVQNPESEIDLEEARQEDPDIQVGGSLRVTLETEGLGRIAAQMAKQVIIQRVREAERSNIYGEFKDRQGELITGVVSQVERGNIFVDIGRAEAFLPRREQIFREVYKRGDRIRAYILEVREATKGPQIVLSRTHPGLLIRLFELEVPEIYDGVVEIKGCVREPSGRSKVAVMSHDRDIDPVGACVGTRGSRVQAIVQELRGEKIDIIAWGEDIRTYAANALSPAKIQHITLQEDEGRMEVLVPDDQLSLAIGKGGQNVRLAAKLLGWKVDLKGESEYRRMIAEQAFTSEGSEEAEPGAAEEAVAAESDLANLESVGDKMVQLLSENGFPSIASVAKASLDELCEVPGIGPKRAQLLIDSAISYADAPSGDAESKEVAADSDDTKAETEETEGSSGEEPPEDKEKPLADQPQSEVTG